MKSIRYTVLILAVALVPSTASANAGTPLMWAGAFHLLIGNAIIGVAEGLFLARFFRCAAQRSILILILANYVSAFAGAVLLSGSLVTSQDITIKNVGIWLCIFVAVTFLLTLLIELPFFWLVLRRQKQSLRRAIKATVATHCISYSLLIGTYLLVSPVSMVTHLKVVAPDELLPGGDFMLYFISPAGEQVLQRPFRSDGQAKAIAQISAKARNDRLFARPNAEDGFDLFALVEEGQNQLTLEILIKRAFASKAPLESPIAEDPSAAAVSYHFIRPGLVPSLVPGSDWAFYTGYWPAAGIRAENEVTGRKLHVALETPFVGWLVQCATHIEGDYVIFQLGRDQICILHPESRKIALIARGRGPVVAKPLASADE